MTPATTILVVLMSAASQHPISVAGYETRAECEADQPAVEALYREAWSESTEVWCAAIMRPKKRPPTAESVLRDLRELLADGASEEI